MSQKTQKPISLGSWQITNDPKHLRQRRLKFYFAVLCVYPIVRFFFARWLFSGVEGKNPDSMLYGYLEIQKYLGWVLVALGAAVLLAWTAFMWVYHSKRPANTGLPGMARLDRVSKILDRCRSFMHEVWSAFIALDFIFVFLLAFAYQAILLFVADTVCLVLPALMRKAGDGSVKDTFVEWISAASPGND